MRSPLLLSFALVACASSSPTAPTSTAPNVRARLAAPTRLLLATTSTGSVTAKRWTHDGWQSGSLALQLADGDVTATASDRLAMSELRVDFAPIAVPESVFGKPARLDDVRLALASTPAAADVAWSDDDDATATPTVALDLSWTFVVDGSATPLGTQHLSAMPVAISLSGDGAHVDATLAAHATGAVWSWAGLLELDDLELALDAATVD